MRRARSRWRRTSRRRSASRRARPQGLPDGEYRVHMLFRAIPPATPVVQPTDEQPKGVQFKLTPVYGVTIPVIVRLGNLQATAGIANVHLEKKRRRSRGRPRPHADRHRARPMAKSA